jgi:uncharacterized protein
MIVLLSPAKKMQDVVDPVKNPYTLPEHIEYSEKLVKKLKRLSTANLRDLMGINNRIAEQNKARFAYWHLPFKKENATTAILSFTGDVYLGLDAKSLGTADLNFAQKHLRILSGLYGILRPLDLIQPYRLEMGTNFSAERHKDLYSFWGKPVNQSLIELMVSDASPVLVNLASTEYFSVVETKKIPGRILTISFKEWKNNQWNIFFVNLKRARGMMARFIIENRINNPDDLRAFDSGNYHFNQDLSSDDHFVFTR